MRGIRILVSSVLLGLVAGACAEGYAKEPEEAKTTLYQAPVDVGGGVSGVDDSQPEPTGGTGAVAMTDGRTPCMMGDNVPCMCAEPGSMGTAVCQFATDSPLGGWLSECLDCVTPEPPPDPDPPPVGGMMAGTGAMAGTGSMGTDAGPIPPGPGDVPDPPGSQDAGASPPPPPPPPPPQTGGGGGGINQGSCSPPCNQACFPIGIIACCNALNLCGCTWAPGGYCL